LRHAMVMVAGDVAGVVILYLARRVGKYVPDARPAAIFVHGPFDLVARGGSAPDEVGAGLADLVACGGHVRRVYTRWPCDLSSLMRRRGDPGPRTPCVGRSRSAGISGSRLSLRSAGMTTHRLAPSGVDGGLSFAETKGPIRRPIKEVAMSAPLGRDSVR